MVGVGTQAEREGTQHERSKETMTRRNWGPLVAAIVLTSVCAVRSTAGPYILVNGQSSDNVVKFDLTTGSDTLFAQYPNGSMPRNLAVRSSDGAVFASLHQGTQSVVRLAPQDGTDVWHAVPFAPSIGGLGPAQLAIYQGDVFAAGDTSRRVFRYDGVTGAQVASYTMAAANIRGMTIKGSTLYYAEIFQETVRTFDLSQNPAVGGTLFANSPNVNEPFHLTIGHTGNLFITNRADGFVREFDPISGALVGTFININTFDPLADSHNMIEYVPLLDSYFVSTGRDTVYQISRFGTLMETYQSDLLDVALGVAFVVPEPGSLLLAGTALLTIAVVVWRRRRQHSSV